MEVYNYFRTYDPSTGRYLESDPIGLNGGLNTYSYVSNMPTMRTDRFGLYEGDGTFPGYDPSLVPPGYNWSEHMAFREFHRICRMVGYENCDQPWEGENESMCFVGDAMDVGFAALGARASASRFPASRLAPRLQQNPFAGGRTPTSTELSNWAAQQGWKPSQTAAGPLKYTDTNGVVRLTLKRGSSRTPGSGSPHAELRNASGQRVDPAGNPVNRRSPGNHTPIIYD